MVEVGGEGVVSGGGKSVSDGFDVSDEAPPFLDDDDAGAGGGWFG